MQRFTSQPRTDWESIVESQGFHFHTLDDAPYWDESAYYAFSPDQIEALETATLELDRMCLEAVNHVIRQNLFDRFQIPREFADYVSQSWRRDEITIYGRFDLAYDGEHPPKMLEYNADTPTALLEAAVIQWFWLKDVFPALDQFNSIHEQLIEAWKRYASEIDPAPLLIYFAAMHGQIEDFMTVNYLRDTAMQAGLNTAYIDIEQIGWNEPRREFVDVHERRIDTAFKLYPWEWMIREQFGAHVLTDCTRWLEAPWKMILSNKAILAVLYELFPESPYLLEARFDKPPPGESYVRKPFYSREGANIATIGGIGANVVSETPGLYGGPYVYQRLAPLAQFDGNYPIIGSWMVNGFACGIGIREDSSPITGNTSRFVPHVIQP